MLEPNRIQTNVHPQTFQKLGDGTYYYNYDVKELLVNSSELEDTVETWYNFIQVLLRGQPDYKKCVQAIIRQYISLEDELSLVNRYNKYLLGLNTDIDAYNDYLEYINLVSEIQTKIKADFNIETSLESKAELIPSLKDIANLTKILIKSATLTDQEALQCKSLYPSWYSYIGKALKINDKVTYKGRLYKVTQAIDKVAQTPTDTSLYEEIVEEHVGTLQDLIPYNNNMSLEKGKYYIQNKIKYLCTRSTGQAVCDNLSDLINSYVTTV